MTFDDIISDDFEQLQLMTLQLMALQLLASLQLMAVDSAGIDVSTARIIDAGATSQAPKAEGSIDDANGGLNSASTANAAVVAILGTNSTSPTNKQTSLTNKDLLNLYFPDKPWMCRSPCYWGC
jgi:hypothetical protein